MHAFDEDPRPPASGQVRPLHVPEFLGHAGVDIDRGVDHHRQQECLVVGHVKRSVHRQIPFAAEVTFLARLRVGRDHGHKQRALLDLPADRRIPRVAPPQRTLVEPDVQAYCAQRVADAPGSLRVL
jgi:hypothetical protein